MWHAESTVRWACNAALKKGTKTRIVLTKSFSNCNRHCVMQTACKKKKEKQEKKNSLSLIKVKIHIGRYLEVPRYVW